MSVYLQDPDVTIHQGDVLDVLRELPSESVHMCCTSPPFYGLRDYGTGSWEGGDEGCDHATGKTARNDGDRNGADGFAGNRNLEGHADMGTLLYRDLCGKCGARRVDQQIGLESTPDLWVARLVEVFREVRRVLRNDGTLWLEIGDSYNSPGGRSVGRNESTQGRPYGADTGGATGKSIYRGAKEKDLIGAPWLLAFALRADGWYLRSEIIWAKPNPMPESVSDRPTTSHSRVFMLAKQPRYFYDADAVREPHTPGTQYTDAIERPMYHTRPQPNGRGDARADQRELLKFNPAGRNRRTVWTIPTQPYPEAHFATWPEALCRDMILAGTSERGVCPECGAPWERVVESELVKSPVHGAGSTVRSRHEDDPNGWAGETYPRLDKKVTTVGWQPGCTCKYDADGLLPSPSPVPATVLDPFGGSGTTAHVARKHGRKAILIELNAEYCALAARRLQQQSLFA